MGQFLMDLKDTHFWLSVILVSFVVSCIASFVPGIFSKVFGLYTSRKIEQNQKFTLFVNAIYGHPSLIMEAWSEAIFFAVLGIGCLLFVSAMIAIMFLDDIVDMSFVIAQIFIIFVGIGAIVGISRAFYYYSAAKAARMNPRNASTN